MSVCILAVKCTRVFDLVDHLDLVCLFMTHPSILTAERTVMNYVQDFIIVFMT